MNAIDAPGFGEVLRANDTRLHRNVTIKVLLDLFAKDPELLARFQRGTSIRVAMEGNASG